VTDFKRYVVMGAGIAAGFILVSLVAGTVGKNLRF
jgi:hypothetical protein